MGPSEIRLESDMSDSPDFYISEIRGDRFTDFCVHTARFSGNRLQKVGRLEKIGWDHGLKANIRYFLAATSVFAEQYRPIVLFTPHVPVFYWPNIHNFRDIELKFGILP